MKKTLILLILSPVFISAQKFKPGFDTELSYIMVNADGNFEALEFESLYTDYV